MTGMPLIAMGETYRLLTLTSILERPPDGGPPPVAYRHFPSTVECDVLYVCGSRLRYETSHSTVEEVAMRHVRTGSNEGLPLRRMEPRIGEPPAAAAAGVPGGPPGGAARDAVSVSEVV